MKTPYWQITVETPRYGRGESILEQDEDKANQGRPSIYTKWTITDLFAPNIQSPENNIL